MTASMRLPTPTGASERGSQDGLAYTLWRPPSEAWARLVILHGAGSCKESHHDFARTARASGLAVACFDQRGHGESEGELGAGAVDDVASIASLLGGAPLVLRGSSMGGWLALVAGAQLGAAAIVAICPASGEGLLRGLRTGSFDFRADGPSLEALLESSRLSEVVAGYERPVLILHAEGDERVPVEHSLQLEPLLRHPHSRVITLPGGHHRSVQHDPELQSVALRWLRQALAPADAARSVASD